jgi:hypothetical protein
LPFQLNGSLKHIKPENAGDALQHYALEPARQVAVGVMHTIHRQLGYEANFSPLQQVFGGQVYVKRQDYLLMAPDAAELGLSGCWHATFVFGDARVGPRSIAELTRGAIDLCQEVRVRVPEASISPIEVAGESRGYLARNRDDLHDHCDLPAVPVPLGDVRAGRVSGHRRFARVVPRVPLRRHPGLI